jgi:hypothetical protein
MPLNKFAPWGVEPIATPRPPGLGALVRVGFQALDKTMSTRLTMIGEGVTKIAGRLPGAPTPPVPSASALRVIWSLNAVRDALSDQGEPSVDSTNAQIEDRRASQAVEDIAAFLARAYPPLHAGYLEQFRPLADVEDSAAFYPARRKRLAELTAFELKVMAEVADPPLENGPPRNEPPSPPTVAAVRAGRESRKRR